MIPFKTIQDSLMAVKGGPVEVIIPSSTGHSFLCTCPNPQHHDHNPSCVGDLVMGFYKCLECGFSGTVEYNSPLV